MSVFKNSKLIISFVFCVIMLSVCFVSVDNNVYATDDEGQALLDKLQDLSDQIDDQKDAIKASENAIANATNKIAEYEKQKKLIQEQADLQQQEIDATNELIALKQDEILAKVLELQETKDMFEARLNAQQIKGVASDLETLLGVDTFADMLRASFDLQKVAEQDQMIIELLREQQAALEKDQDELEVLIAELEVKLAELEQTVQKYADLIQQTDKQISSTEALVQAQEETLKDIEQAYAEADAAWKEWTASNDSGGVDYTNGEYTWPVPGYSYMSSNYGWRTLSGKSNFHRGIDLAAAAGTPIYAACGGVVSTNNHDSYGISVKISVNGNTTNIYGHMISHAPGIADGVVVKQGQLIGYVGSTGHSTGNHLHFEVDINGDPVNPWSYFD